MENTTLGIPALVESEAFMGSPITAPYFLRLYFQYKIAFAGCSLDWR